MNSHTLLWLTTFIMTGAGLFILLTGKRRTPSEELNTVLHGIVPLIAACSYFAMATGQGAVILGADAAAVGTGAGRIFYFARYIDWTFTTPLLLVTLSMTAMHAGEKRAGAIAGVVLADLMMILTALFFGASEVAWIKWTWFLISCVAFLGVYYVIWVSQIQANALERDDVRANYRRDATILSVLWLIYPVILAVSPDGLNWVGDTAGVLGIAILDVLSKVVYGVMTVASDSKMTERDLAEAGRPAPLRKAA
jgi:bacteriorhodopsin